MLEYLLETYTDNLVITKNPVLLAQMNLNEDFYKGIPLGQQLLAEETVKRSFILSYLRDFADCPEEIILHNPDLVTTEEYLEAVPSDVLKQQLTNVVASIAVLPEASRAEVIELLIARTGDVETFIELSDYQSMNTLDEELSSVIDEICLRIVDTVDLPIEEVLNGANMNSGTIISTMTLLSTKVISESLLSLHCNQKSSAVPAALMNLLLRCSEEDELLYIRRAAAIIG